MNHTCLQFSDSSNAPPGVNTFLRVNIFFFIALLLLTGCAASGEVAPATDSPLQEATSAVLITPSPVSQPGATSPVTAGPSATPPLDPEAQPPDQATATYAPIPVNDAANLMVEQATGMLADKLGIDPQAISLFSLQAVDWPDELLGCPLGNQNYAQVITPGYLIELRVERTVYEFHTNQTGRAVLCGIAPTMEIYQPP